jgi:hypothetical protein
MIYCDECAFDRGWVESNRRIVTQCELCGRTDSCSDTPTSRLPKPPRKTEETEESDEQ